MTPEKHASRATRRVLVVFPGALGDLMCLMPALAAMSRRHPGASIELMARFELARLVAGGGVGGGGASFDERRGGGVFFFLDSRGWAPIFFSFFLLLFLFSFLHPPLLVPPYG